MRIIEPSYTFEYLPDADQVHAQLERAARTCYKSEDKITPASAPRILYSLIDVGHDSVLEHAGISVRIVCDRGISHEIVRHRLASFSQESTRYANYLKEKFGSEITVIRPFFWPENTVNYLRWLESCEKAEDVYLAMLRDGATPQEARTVLPNSLKTEIVVTANIREWRHILTLRCAPAAHPQIRQIMIPILSRLCKWSKPLFGDIETGSGWRGIPFAKEILGSKI